MQFVKQNTTDINWSLKNKHTKCNTKKYVNTQQQQKIIVQNTEEEKNPTLKMSTAVKTAFENTRCV